MRRTRGLLIFPCLLVIASTFSTQEPDALSEGVTLHKKSSLTGMMGGGTQSETSIMYLDQNTIHEVKSNGQEFIVFMNLQKYISIDHNKKSYYEVSFADVNEKLSDVSGQISERSKEDHQAMQLLQQIMGTSGSGEITVEKLGPGEQVAGFDTQQYLITMSPIKMQLWVAPALKVPSAYYDSMKLQAPANPVFDMQKIFEAFKQIDGMSLKTVVTFKMMGMESTSTDEVIEVETGPVPEPEIPEGYQLEELQLHAVEDP